MSWLAASSAALSLAIASSTVVKDHKLRIIYRDWFSTPFRRVSLIAIVLASVLLLTFAEKDGRVRIATEKAVLALIIVFFARIDEVFAPFWAVLGLSYLLGI